MSDWTKVVTQPIGLAGFALFVVFGLLAKTKKKPTWLVAGFFALASVALIGGLAIGYFEVQHGNPPSHSKAVSSLPSKTNPEPAQSNQQVIGEINQNSTGTGAVNAGGVQGQVTVTIPPAEQSSDKPTPKKPKQTQK